MYQTPKVERFGSLGKLTLFKPHTGVDLAQPDQNQCTEPAQPGAENSAFCIGGTDGRS